MTPEVTDHALPCRPTIACTADIVPPGAFEVEDGALVRRNTHHAEQATSPLLLKQTFTELLQLQLGTNGYSVVRGRVPAQYVDDLLVGPKLHLVDQTRLRPSIALSADASIPTFRVRGYLRTYDALFTGFVTKDIGPIHADLNAGVNLWRIENHPQPQEFVALALSANLVAPLGVMVEGYAFTSAPPVATRDGGILFALSLAPRPWLIFDVGGDAGFYPSVRSFSAFAGLTIVPWIFWR